jgi:hypothetical protein
MDSLAASVLIVQAARAPTASVTLVFAGMIVQLQTVRIVLAELVCFGPDSDT